MPEEKKSTFLDGHKPNFKTLLRAVREDDVALMECKDIKTGELVAVICVARWDGDGVEMVPFAKMFSGNPYEEVLPPSPLDDLKTCTSCGAKEENTPEKTLFGGLCGECDEEEELDG